MGIFVLYWLVIVNMILDVLNDNLMVMCSY